MSSAHFIQQADGRVAHCASLRALATHCDVLGGSGEGQSGLGRGACTCHGPAAERLLLLDTHNTAVLP
jgi:hypothetical protein